MIIICWSVPTSIDVFVKVKTIWWKLAVCSSDCFFTPSKHSKTPGFLLSCIWALEICFEVDNILSLALDMSARILSDIQYVCRISFSPWIEMLTFAVTAVSRGRRWSDVPCHSLTPHSIAPPPEENCKYFQLFPRRQVSLGLKWTWTGFSWWGASAVHPGEGEESSAWAKFMASGSDSSTPSSLLKCQKVGKKKWD